MLQIINSAVSVAVEKTVERIRAEQLPRASEPPAANYFRVMEKLLYNYPALKKIVSDKEAYTKIEWQEKSKDIVRHNSNASWKSKEDIIEGMEREREAEYDITVRQFQRVERVIELHKNRKEFIVIQMYYFDETIDGKPRPADDPEYTWAEISFQLGRDEKTLRRWRGDIVNDMAICLFGISAAVQQ